MEAFYQFIDPEMGFESWLVNMVVVFFGASLLSWLFALVLCRVGWKLGGDTQLRVYAGWMTSFSVLLLFTGAALILASIHYKQLDIPFCYGAPWALLVLVFGGFSLSMCSHLKRRMNEIERRFTE